MQNILESKAKWHGKNDFIIFSMQRGSLKATNGTFNYNGKRERAENGYKLN